MLIKYIKSVLWRVAKCLSYIEEARCLKVKFNSAVGYEAQMNIQENSETNVTSRNWFEKLRERVLYEFRGCDNLLVFVKRRRRLVQNARESGLFIEFVVLFVLWSLCRISGGFTSLI